MHLFHYTIETFFPSFVGVNCHSPVGSFKSSLALARPSIEQGENLKFVVKKKQNEEVRKKSSQRKKKKQKKIIFQVSATNQ